ncbi:glycosyltransferase family 2 protein [Ornithinimicrobium avium]|uniref:Glycosyltransferase family 2 protein n=1 Tax=Ornithinimicrobium avium TaxID=2283195 RepID=A0A345NMW1_9MICO|nr:glycosyltransferase family 2 protein [Ornithinimicrobium avium]AXH96369.1 glycosyltransferase family 2 protein [Ornithinimicrobium avium]
MVPDVSFVVPAHNAERTLAATISSALAQEGVTVEVVVVDDASSDRTAEIAESFGPPVHVLRNRTNQGEGRSRNRAIENARGRWVSVLDADDTVAQARSRRLLDRAEAAEGLPIVVDNILMHRYRPGDGDAGVSVTSWPMFRPARLAGLGTLTLAEFVRGSRPLRSWSEAYGYLKPTLRRDFVAEHGLTYSPHLRVGADFYFLARALHFAGAAAVEPLGGYHYTIYPESVSARVGPPHIKAWMRADAAILEECDLEPTAQKAFEHRSAILHEALEYVRLASLLRDRDVVGAARQAAANPLLLIHLSRPVWWRARRAASWVHAEASSWVRGTGRG